MNVNGVEWLVKTVTTVPLSDQINGIVGGSDHYVAVSSIVLEDQNLVGSIVTELTQLRYRN